MWGSCRNSRQTESVSNPVRELSDRWKKRQKTERQRNKDGGSVVLKKWKWEGKRGGRRDGGVKTRIRKSQRQRKKKRERRKG